MHCYFLVSCSSQKPVEDPDEAAAAAAAPGERMQLTLTPAVNDVSGGRSTCLVKVNGAIVKLKTSEYYEPLEMPMPSSVNTKTNSVCVKVDEQMRCMLDKLECELRKQLPKGFVYKPLYQGDNMCVKLSRFCKYFVYDELNKVKKVSGDMAFKQGDYVFILRIPHLYVGPHQNGEQCSLSMDIDEVYYRPDKDAIVEEKKASPWSASFFRG